MKKIYIQRAIWMYFYLLLYFGRFENSKNYFWDLLTFNLSFFHNLDNHSNKVLPHIFQYNKLMIGATLAWLYCESLVNCDLFIKFPLYRKCEWHLQRIGASSLNNASLLHSASYENISLEFQVWLHKISKIFA